MEHRGGARVEGYFRVAAMSFALYDALWTIPTEISIYREQKSFTRITRCCLLFIFMRYTSVLVIVSGNIGFFYEGFTEQSCNKYFLLTPSFKVIQTMISQLILAVRTVAVARNTRWVVWVMSIAFVIAVALEFFGNIWARLPFREPVDAIHSNCTSGNAKGLKVVWVHYLAAMLYDITCLSIATGFIYAQSRKLPNHSLDYLSKMLLREGLLYFTYLTAANILNLVLYIVDTAQAQSSGATLGYVVTWIMTQRLLIHLREIRHKLYPPGGPVSNDPAKCNFYVAQHHDPRDELELGVHVTIEESVKVDYDKDISPGLISQHRITTARIERDHRRREERRKVEEDVRDEETTVDCGTPASFAGKGWQITSVGKLSSP